MHAFQHPSVYVSAGRFPETLLGPRILARASALSTKKIASEIQSEEKMLYCKIQFLFLNDTDPHGC